eukprot:gene45316-50390_t
MRCGRHGTSTLLHAALPSAAVVGAAAAADHDMPAVSDLPGRMFAVLYSPAAGAVGLMTLHRRRNSLRGDEESGLKEDEVNVRPSPSAGTSGQAYQSAGAGEVSAPKSPTGGQRGPPRDHIPFLLLDSHVPRAHQQR